MTSEYYYLIHIQYLGYRFHGWQHQPDQKTVQGMVDKTLRFVLNHDNFKTLGAGRTDAMVSANHMILELFINEQLDEQRFLSDLNSNFPTDIKATIVEQIDSSFNIIQSPKEKEYHYLFCYGGKPHPFSASLMAFENHGLDISLMARGAKLFEGKHNFSQYCVKPSKKTNVIRTISCCEIVVNDVYKANFFPEISHLLRVKSNGFLRNQIRLMMGSLFALGRHELNLESLEQTIKQPSKKPLRNIAPASGLILHKISLIPS